MRRSLHRAQRHTPLHAPRSAIESEYLDHLQAPVQYVLIEVLQSQELTESSEISGNSSITTPPTKSVLAQLEKGSGSQMGHANQDHLAKRTEFQECQEVQRCKKRLIVYDFISCRVITRICLQWQLL